MVVQPIGNNAQHQPLTTVLRNIIREYPAGGGVLRELCQNADDSGATTIEFLLDTSTYPAEPLLHAGLAGFQGPSLLAYNNRTFSKKDFRSLSRIGDSEKMSDMSSTGKFGRGFNSVYNFTDNPSILSGSSLLILDPHEAWSREVGEPGGPMYDFVESCREPEMANQLAAFGRLLPDSGSAFDGTLIRLPLRTAEQAQHSKILLDLDRSSTEINDIKTIFASFANEMADSLLLLRHISSITLRIDDEIFAKAVSRKFDDTGDITDTFSIDVPYQSVLVRGDEPEAEIHFVTEITFQHDGKEEISKYAVTHLMRHETGEPELGKWARKYKLFPWTAVASPISRDSGTGFSGKLFSTLPLPVRVNHPAHIHAMFSITPDRASIHKDEDSTASENSETKRGARWNKWVFQELVVRAWIGNLQHIQELTLKEQCPYSGWSLWPVGSENHEEHRAHGSAILGLVFEKIVAEGRNLLPTINDSTACASEVLFAEKLEESLKNALRNAGVVVILPSIDRKTEISRKLAPEMGINHVSPRSVRAALTALGGAGMQTLDASSRSVLLDYILSDSDYEDIGRCTAPLIPLADGLYGSFQISPTKYRLNSRTESGLFTEYKAFTIDDSKLSDGAHHHFVTAMDAFQKFTNIAPWDIPGACRYLNTYVFSSKGSMKGQSNDIITRPDLMEWIGHFWEWAVLKEQDGVVSAMKDFWLIPLFGGRLRKLSHSQPALDISSCSQVAQLFREIISSSRTVFMDYPIYSESLSQKVSRFFRDSKLIVQCENFEELVTWLGENPSFLNIASHKQRSQLVLQLGGMSAAAKYQNMSWREKYRILPVVRILRELPLYHEAFTRGKERPWISLHKDGMSYVAVSPTDGLPALQVPKTTFIDKDIPGVDRIVSAFCLTAIPSSATLLEQYVLVDMRGASTERKSALSKYVLRPRCFVELSKEARDELATTRFVPVRGAKGVFATPEETVDPAEHVSRLYFEDEGVFPEISYLDEFRESLKMLRMVTLCSAKILLRRIEMYSGSGRGIEAISEKVRHLLVLNPRPLLLTTHHRLRWIPASMDGITKLCNAVECRDTSQEALVKYSMPLAMLEFPRHWRRSLGWEERPDRKYILKQLDEAVARRETPVVLSLLKSGWLSGIQELDARAWIPGALGGYYQRSSVFCKSAGFHPYIDNINPDVQVCLKNLSEPMFEIAKEPSFQKLQEVHDTLAAKKTLDAADLKVFVALLGVVALQFGDSDFASWKAPDINGELRALPELTAGTFSGDSDAMNVHFLHQTIPPAVARVMEILTIQERFLQETVGPEFVQDYEQSEDLTTVISDTLKRYSSRRTFNEYLTNAEDSGSAHDIRWILDQTECYERANLITKELEECHGPSLMCFNDGVFQEKDFESIVKIGVGSRGDEPSKIGRFGRGSLTMYHYTSTPMILSGEYFVIFDPEQLRLPKDPATRKRRRGMRMTIRQVRKMWPDQLRPFVGQFGFTAESDSFSGTLFRFPIMASRENSKLYSSHGPTTIQTVTAALLDYQKDAVTALVFLKNIKSIRFEIRGGQTAVVPWEITAEGQSRLPSGILRLKIVDKMRRPGATAGFVSKVAEWMVVRSVLKPHEIPNDLQKTRERHRLEARCGIAAQIVPKGSINGRLFLGAPTDHMLGLPVHVLADLAIQSDRHAFLEDDGEDWNRWIMESQATPLYATLLTEIAKLPGYSTFHFWPEYPRGKAKSDGVARVLGNLLKESFWRQITEQDCQWEVFPVHGGATQEVTTVGHACFNLLSHADMPRILLDLLPRMHLYGLKLVNPIEKAQSGFRILQEGTHWTTGNTISPEFVARLFKDPKNCALLWEEWRTAHGSVMKAIRGLFEFILAGDPGLEELTGCTILPLADGNQGTFEIEGDANFIIPPNSNSSLSKELLALVPHMVVHPELGKPVLDRLISLKLNVSAFSLYDVPRVIAAMGVQTAKRKREFFVQIWKVYNSQENSDPTEAKRAYEVLACQRIIVATRLGDASEVDFYRLDDFRRNMHTAVIEEPWRSSLFTSDLAKYKAILQSFADVGFFQVDARTFPESQVPSETLQTCQGLYRFLRCIKSLAEKERSTIEAFVRSRSIGIPEYLKTLSKMLRLANWSGFDSSCRQHATEILREIPLLPTTGGPEEHISAQKARLAPSTSLNLQNLPLARNFVINTWAEGHTEILRFLRVPQLDLHEFLERVVLVVKGSRLPSGAEGLQNYIKVVEWVNGNFPSSMQTEPIALNGNLTFCMANTLFDHQNEVFQAAFRHNTSETPDHNFLHPGLRGFSWETNRTINSARVYERCARAIHEQSLAFPDASFLHRAKIVFEFLRFETPEVRNVCGSRNSTWMQITRIQFVPSVAPGSNHTLRGRTMRSISPATRVISLSEGIDPKYIETCWSQKPFFLAAPSSTVLQSLPRHGRPSPQDVVSHLVFLAQNRHSLPKDERQGFATSAKECYKYLQESSEEFILPEDEEVWYNTDEEAITSQEDFIGSWVSTKDLCLNLPYDSLPLRRVCQSLQNFHGLLRVSGVRTIQRIGPPPSHLVAQTATDYSNSLLEKFQHFRLSGLHTDLSILVDDVTLGAHKVVLCATSEYFRKMFESKMVEQQESTIDWRNSGMCAETVTRILDYMYTGVLAKFPPEDPTHAIGILLEIMRASDCYILPGLKRSVEAMLWDEQYLRPETAMYILQCARECKTEELVALAERFCSANADIVKREFDSLEF